MSQSTRRSRHRQAGVGQVVSSVPPSLARLLDHAPGDPSRRARARLAMLEWHAAHGHRVSLTARHFGWSRPTVVSLARPPRWPGREPRGSVESSAALPPAHLDPRAALRGAGAATALSPLGQGQARGPAATRGHRALGLDDRAHPRPAAARRRPRRAPPAGCDQAGAPPGPTPRGAQAEGLQGGATRRHRAGRHRRGAPARLGPAAQAVHRAGRHQPLGHARAGPQRHCPPRGHHPRRAGRAPALRAAGGPGRRWLRVHGRVRDRLCRSGHRPLRPATAQSPSSTAMSSGPTAPTPPSPGRSPTPSPSSSHCVTPCSSGRRATTPSGPTRPWAT